jgi:HPt (histidine-containing phosphotransfer) domain-containing protein
MGDTDDEFPDIELSDIVIPGIDAQEGSELYGGEMDIYISVLKSFSGSIPAALDKLRAVSAETLPQYATVVHGLKGSCASIAAGDVKKTAYDLELKAKAGDLDGVLTGNEALLKKAEQLVKDIQNWLDSLK